MPFSQVQVYDPGAEPDWHKFRGKKARAIADSLGFGYEQGTPALTHLYDALGPQGMVQAIMEQRAANDRSRQLGLEAMYAPWKNITNPARDVMSREDIAAGDRDLRRDEGEANRQNAIEVAKIRTQQQRANLTERLQQEAMNREAAERRHRETLANALGISEAQIRSREGIADSKNKRLEEKDRQRAEEEAARQAYQEWLQREQLKAKYLGLGGPFAKPTENLKLYQQNVGQSPQSRSASSQGQQAPMPGMMSPHQNMDPRDPRAMYPAAWQAALQKHGGNEQAALMDFLQSMQPQ